MSERDGARRKVKRFLTVFVVVANLVLVDAVVKELAAGYLKDRAAISVIPGFFNLAYLENRGCAWGMFQGHVWPLAVFGLVALGLLIWKRDKVFKSSTRFAWMVRTAEPLLYAGIIGNLIDRLWRGYVIDLFDFYLGSSHFPCFNVADSAITIAAILMIVASMLEPRVGFEPTCPEGS